MADANAKPFLFISHKHENHRIADAIRKFVDVSTGGLVEVYQSSSDQTPRASRGIQLKSRTEECLMARWRFRSDLYTLHSRLELLHVRIWRREQPAKPRHEDDSISML
jgi:hypothetical protein